MRILVLMRGVPASGKSTWIAKNRLEAYAISPDTLRLLHASPTLSVDNHLGIPQESDNAVWKLLLELLEARMAKGEFSIIDATHVKHSAIRRYEDLCEKYRYRIVVVDFSDVPLEVALERNAARGRQNIESNKNTESSHANFIESNSDQNAMNADFAHYKSVKESVIYKMHESLQESLKSPLPSKYKVIKPHDTTALTYAPLDLSKYKKIHHFGDIHGCYSALIRYFLYQNGADSMQEFIASCVNSTQIQREDSTDSMDFTESSAPISQKIQSIAHKALLKSDEYYIFCGDYIDRGVENGKVLRFLLDIMELPNVCLIEGNHERYLRKWGNDEEINTLEFKRFTLRDLQSCGITQRDARNIYRKLRQCALYTFSDIDSIESKAAQNVTNCNESIESKCTKKVLVTHGGLPSLPHNLLLISTHNLIYGSGDYGDVSVCASSFTHNSKEGEFQVFGHRNKEELPLRYEQKNFVLEGKVEFGGALRIVTLEHIDSHFKQPSECLKNATKVTESAPTESSLESNDKIRVISHNDGFSEIYVKNDLHKNALEYMETYNLLKLIEDMRKSPMVREKKFFNERISSFNFSPKAFFAKSWNALTCKARGLFVDIEAPRILARSYNKFFNLNEMPHLSLDSIKENLTYPLNVYVKENGYLGILSVDNDEFFLTSKSDPTSEYSAMFKSLFDAHFMSLDSINFTESSQESAHKNRSENNGEKLKNKLKYFLKSNNLSLIFEVIEPCFDPHIIEYDAPQIILLDAIFNTLDSKKLPFSELENLAKTYGFKLKIRACKLRDSAELEHFIENVSRADFTFIESTLDSISAKNTQGRYIEGFVIEDSKGFMFKVKLHYYNTWKALRGSIELSLQKEHLILQKMLKQSAAANPFISEFWAFIENLVAKKGLQFLQDKDIITLRKMWEDSKMN